MAIIGGVNYLSVWFNDDLGLTILLIESFNPVFLSSVFLERPISDSKLQSRLRLSWLLCSANVVTHHPLFCQLPKFCCHLLLFSPLCFLFLVFILKNPTLVGLQEEVQVIRTVFSRFSKGFLTLHTPKLLNYSIMLFKRVQNLLIKGFFFFFLTLESFIKVYFRCCPKVVGIDEMLSQETS